MKKSAFFPSLFALCMLMGAPEALAQTGAPATETANGNLVGMARLSPKHTTLLKALKAVGLEDEAQATTKYTVFAPTNAAFDKLPGGKLDELLKPANQKQLALLLSYHVVSGSYLAANLKDRQVLKTLQGESLTVMRQGDAVTLKDAKGNTVNVVNDDIIATNGIVHPVDGVLMPANLETARSSGTK